MDPLHDRIEKETLEDLIDVCAQVSGDCMSIANSLNTTPVTLSTLAKESRAVTEALERLYDLSNAASAKEGAESIQASNNKYVYSVARDIHELRSALKRIRGPDRDSGIDLGEPSLIIVWNEPGLKEISKRLRTHQASLHTLLNAAVR